MLKSRGLYKYNTILCTLIINIYKKCKQKHKHKLPSTKELLHTAYNNKRDCITCCSYSLCTIIVMKVHCNTFSNYVCTYFFINLVIVGVKYKLIHLIHLQLE